MRRTLVSCLLATMVVVLSGSSTGAEEKTTTVKGYVLDSACAFIRNVTKPRGEGCALKCAKAGSPLVILTDEGTLYWPISDTMPATGQNERLMKFAGQKVIASGKAYERGGSHALVIEKIVVAPVGR